ncbi:hypothetical protein EYF80_065246 [Liparis tanakae]|uniref:Uncharacterized protein n=1 Tax=Liparis tanakae TaxID=230148 RepID=A0A4Z2E778_9TELE|nr:hypothetical protein EYF80_065246 [Liparis tanakae]
MVLVHLTRVYDGQVDWSHTSRGNLPRIGMKLRGPTQAQRLSTPPAVQLQVDPPPPAIVVQPQADPYLQLGEHRGQLLHFQCIYVTRNIETHD